MFEEPNYWLAGGGLAVGFTFGFLAQRSRFCVLAAVSNLVLIRDYRQFHAWLAALAVAVAGAALLEQGGWVAIAESGYRRPAVNWLGALGGGLVFGWGTMLAGGCASRTLIRSMEGNLGSMVALAAFALAAMATQWGFLEPLRAWIIVDTSILLAVEDSSISALLGWPRWIVPATACLVCLAGVFRLGNWRNHRGVVTYGALIGLIVVAGWWVTGVLGWDEFNERPPASLAIAGPLARGTAWLTMRQAIGSEFVLMLIPGVMLGALISAVTSRTFKWAPPASSRVGAYFGGGAMMGVGAITAGGCNIGQGLTGIATLSLTSMLAVTGIVSGMLLGLWWLQRAG